MQKKHIEGKKRGDILLFALSTCVWCKMTKRLLNELGVEYCYIDIDMLDGDEKLEVGAEMRRWNPRQSFPTIIINNEKMITGYDEEEIREALRDE